MIDSKVQSIIRSISSTSNGNFLETITLALADAIDADYVFIANLNDSHTIATTSTVSANGAVADNFSYELKNTPCEYLSHNEVCVHFNDVQSIYPSDQLLIDMGISAYVGIPLINHQDLANAILVALFKKPITSSKETESLFLLFSGLIHKELEKNLYGDKLSLANKVIEQSQSGIIICNSKVEIIYTNRAFTEITGFTNQEVLGCNPSVLSSGKHDLKFYQSMWHELHTKGHWEGEIIDKRKNGESFPDWLTINTLTNEKQEITHYVSNFYDITERKNSEKTISFQANYNALTHLPNRLLFNKILKTNIKELAADKQLGIFLIDIDLFKDVNDFYGHQFGDELLKNIANRLSSAIPENDTVAHFGADNFAVIANNITSSEQATNYANTVMAVFDTAFIVSNITIKCSISCGAVCHPNNWPDLDSFEMAEKAMYQAKEEGRNTLRFFTEDFHQASSRRIEIRNKLSEAINGNCLDVFYQPIYCTQKRKITKCEALVRWKSDNQWITPFEFIPIAEEFGLIVGIGEIVLRKSCEYLKQLKSLGFNDLVISVNRSIYEFPVNERDNNNWIDTITAHGLTANDICFELTESVLAPDKSNNLTLLRHLQKSGSTIALDDFGTGYSSLSYLRRFPIDYLKIDQSFVKDMTENFDDKIIVSTIVAMAKTLKIKIIAEGAETREQVEMLSSLGCDYIQGYHFSKPLPEPEFTQYLTDFNIEN